VGRAPDKAEGTREPKYSVQVRRRDQRGLCYSQGTTKTGSKAEPSWLAPWNRANATTNSV
jgi:hypothetical protein